MNYNQTDSKILSAVKKIKNLKEIIFYNCYHIKNLNQDYYLVLLHSGIVLLNFKSLQNV